MFFVDAAAANQQQ